MKFFLSIAFCFFSVISCSMGKIEYIPGTTKFVIKNESSVDLYDVKWNGVYFGDIKQSDKQEKIVEVFSEAYVYFNLKNGRGYRTIYTQKPEEYGNKAIGFYDSTPVSDNITSTQSTLKSADDAAY